MKDLRLDRLDVIHAGDATFPLADKIRAVALADLAVLARAGRAATPRSSSCAPRQLASAPEDPRFYFGDRVTGFVHALFRGIRGEASASFEGESPGKTGPSS